MTLPMTLISAPSSMWAFWFELQAEALMWPVLIWAIWTVARRAMGKRRAA